MTTDQQRAQPFEVLLAGGGVASLEAAFALRELAGGRVHMKLLAAEPEFVYRPSAVSEPFSYAVARRYPLAEIAEEIGAELVQDTLISVDPAARAVQTAAGSDIPYDALILGLGAHAHARYAKAVTLDDRLIDQLLHGLIQDIEDGYVKSLAFVIPARIAWPLPVYELALMTAARATGMNVETAITIVTPEAGPLAVFGEGASRAVSKLLAENQIDVVTSAYCEVPQSGHVAINPGNRLLVVDRVVALPELNGPAVRGLPAVENGFIPVDQYCKVRGVQRVYAAGDATDFAVKHGGLAALQADTAAREVAALAGAPVEHQPFHPVIRGILLTGGKPRYLSADLTEGRGFSSTVTDEPAWSPAALISAEYLAPYLERHDAADPGRPDSVAAFYG